MNPTILANMIGVIIFSIIILLRIGFVVGYNKANKKTESGKE